MPSDSVIVTDNISVTLTVAGRLLLYVKIRKIAVIYGLNTPLGQQHDEV